MRRQTISVSGPNRILQETHTYKTESNAGQLLTYMHELHLQANRRHIWKQLITMRMGQLAEIGIPVWKIRTDEGYGRMHRVTIIEPLDFIWNWIHRRSVLWRKNSVWRRLDGIHTWWFISCAGQRPSSGPGCTAVSLLKALNLTREPVYQPNQRISDRTHCFWTLQNTGGRNGLRMGRQALDFLNRQYETQGWGDWTRKPEVGRRMQ
jgi:hypothetical protein